MFFKQILFFIMLLSTLVVAQNISYVEYDLDNGLHVILHQDTTVPLVVTSVMYHVGAKDEHPERRGFAHFFEHLLFEGTKHIPRGEFMKIVESNGGSLNANTTQDRTYYYEYFPSNKLELGLWLESERMLHPVINQIGVDTQNEVVKEEKRRGYDNRPYGNVLKVIVENLFEKHPYRWLTIGEMDHLDAATLEEFKSFQQTYYVPNNAVLVVAGNFQINHVKKLINDYFALIPKGAEIVKKVINEEAITKEKRVSYYDANIEIPMSLMCFRTAAMTEKDSYVLELISSILSDGKSSRLYKKLVDEKKMALQIQAINVSLEDYGMYVVLALPLGDHTLDELIIEVEEEITRLQTELISEREYQKLQNIIQNSFVNANSSMAGIANSLARYYLLHNDTSLINNEIAIYQSITRKDILFIANKYLSKQQRIIIDYLPKEEK